MKLIFSCIAFLISTICISQTIDEAFDGLLAQYNMMGMSAVVVCGNNVSFDGHYGLSNFEQNTAVNAETKYRIASISKTITALAFMKLVENGLVNLDDNIGDILGYEIINPNFPLVSITPRMLLSHTSSLQDGSGYNPFLSDTYTETIPSISELITTEGSYFTDNMFLNNSPGTYFAYSNLNFGILGSLIEKISQQRFDVFVNENILIPLEIDGSFNIQDLSSLDNLAVIYRKENNIWTAQADDYQGIFPDPINFDSYTLGDNGLVFAPQGGLRISALDLSKIMILIKNDGEFNGLQILDSLTVAYMRNTEWLYNGSNGDDYGGLFKSWGLGLHKLTNTPNDDVIYENETMLGHAGEAYGLVSDMYFQEQGDFGIIFVTNGIGQAYEYGINSDFYTVEDAAFEILYNYSVSDCLTSTSIGESKNENKFEIFISPNPCNSFVNIEFDNYNNATTRIQMINALGKYISVNPTNHSLGNLQFDTSNLPSGMYQIHFSDGIRSGSKSIVVE